MPFTGAGVGGGGGTVGPRGPAGPPGPSTPSNLSWQGDYDLGASYVLGDVVYADDRTWFARGENIGVTPGTDLSVWAPLAVAGPAGAPGADGAPGAPGGDGAPGRDGTDALPVTVSATAPASPVVGQLWLDTSGA